MFLIALVIGLVLGFLIARQLFPARSSGTDALTPTQTPVAAAPVATGAPALALPEATATLEPTEAPTPVPTPEPTPTVNVLDYFGLTDEDLGVTQAPTATPTPEPTPVATPTQQVVQILPTATPESALLTITPTPAAENVVLVGRADGRSAAAASQTQTVQQDPNAKGGKSNPYLLDEVFTLIPRCSRAGGRAPMPPTRNSTLCAFPSRSTIT